MILRLNPGVVLAISITFIASCGGGGGGSDEAPPVTALPLVPIEVSAYGGPTADSIEVSWKAQAGATSFNIYWSDTDSVTPETDVKVPVAASPALLSGFAPGRYTFIVTAVNAAGESRSSSAAKAYPGVPPKATIIEAVEGTGEVTVSWMNLKYAQSYTLRWKESGVSMPGPTVIPSVTTPFRVDGLTNDRRYEFTVAAVGAGGEGPESQPVDALPLNPPPGWTLQHRVSRPFTGRGGDGYLRGASINDNGVAAVVWLTTELPNDSTTSVLASHNSSGGWSEQVYVDRNDSGSAGVAVAPNNDIFVLFNRSTREIWCRRFTNGQWSDPVRVDDGSSVFARYWADVAVDAVGNVFAVWLEQRIPDGGTMDDARGYVWANRYDYSSSQWGVAEEIGSSPRNAYFLDVSAGGDNMAIAGWLQSISDRDPSMADDGFDAHVAYANAFTNMAWSAATELGPDDLIVKDTATNIGVAINDVGSGVAVWTQERNRNDGNVVYQLEASRYELQTSSWSTAELLDDETGASGRAPIASLDSSGRTIVGWGIINGYKIWGTFYDPVARTWGPSHTMVSSVDYSRVPDRGLGMDSSGGTMLVWAADRPSERLMVKYRPSGALNWEQGETLGGRVGRGVEFAISRTGRAVVATNSSLLYEGKGSHSISVSVYSP